MKVALQLSVVLFVTLSTFCLPNGKWVTGTTGAKGCCPKIDKNHSLIQAFGYRCSAAITVSAGTCPEKNNFLYVVDWGDGTSVTGHKIQLGPFQSVHQYHQQAATYVVTAKYCSDPDGKPEDRCCDSISQKISIPANSSVNVN